MVALTNPLFKLGQVVATPGAAEALQAAAQSPWEFLRRHVAGDWGDVCADDGKANDEAVKDGSRILSAYTTKADTKVWVITEAADDNGQRAATTILLPSDY